MPKVESVVDNGAQRNVLDAQDFLFVVGGKSSDTQSMRVDEYLQDSRFGKTAKERLAHLQADIKSLQRTFRRPALPIAKSLQDFVKKWDSASSPRAAKNQVIRDDLTALRAEIHESDRAVKTAMVVLEAEKKQGSHITNNAPQVAGQKEKNPLQLNPYVHSALSHHLEILNGRSEPTPEESALIAEVKALLTLDQQVEQSKSEYSMAALRARFAHPNKGNP